jgi:hypothetical protein
MKKILYTILFALCVLNSVKAQVAISLYNTDATPDPSAMLDLDFFGNIKSGILIPRIPISLANNSNTISNPADYLLVFSPTENDFSGLNLWNSGKWDNLMDDRKMFNTISDANISQAALYAIQSSGETSDHVTDAKNVKPYLLPINTKIKDSQNGYNNSANNYKYVIPVKGTYEVTCNSVITASNSAVGASSQTFVMKNADMVTNIVVNKTANSADIANTVSYTDSFEKGNEISCAVGFGVWNGGEKGDRDKFKVKSSWIKIVRY